MRAQAAILRSTGGDFSVEPVEVGELRSDEVLVELVGTGVCHTDDLFRSGTYPFQMPCVLGHEGAGKVIDVGDQVDHVAAGQPVVLSVMWCGRCPRCLRGQHYLCHDIFNQNFGGRGDSTTALSQDGQPVYAHFDGQSSFGTHSVANAKTVVPVRDDAPLHLLGPLGCGFRTGLGSVINTFTPKPAESIAVFGVGSVGTSAVIAAELMGCDPIIAVDINPRRRELAVECGASAGVNPEEGAASEQILDLTGGGVDYALDTTGNPRVVRSAVESLAPGGFAGVLGGSPLGTELVLDVNHLLFGGRRIQGINMGDAVASVFIPQMVDLIVAGKLPLERLVTDYPLDRINDAFADMHDGTTVKPILRPSAT